MSAFIKAKPLTAGVTIIQACAVPAAKTTLSRNTVKYGQVSPLEEYSQYIVVEKNRILRHDSDVATQRALGHL